jgi:Cu2+-exporting ATPase/Cu+-exporting ATPase
MELSKTATFPVAGMHCASCAAVISRALGKLPGIKTVRVNYGTEEAVVTYEPGRVDLDRMNREIADLGYRLKTADANLKSGEMQGEAEKELAGEQSAVLFLLPPALFIFAGMLWETLASTGRWPRLPYPEPLWTGIQLILAGVALFGFGRRFLSAVFILIRARKANMDTLIGIGTGVAFFYSSFTVLFPQSARLLGFGGHTYFDVTLIVITFVLLGKYLEKRSKRDTGEALRSLFRLQAKTALLKDGASVREVAAEDLKIGDIIIVRPGTTVPTDGVVVNGVSSINEAMVTGESLPVDVSAGRTVIGGTTNVDGVIECRVTRVGAETVLSRITKLVRDAQNSKAAVEILADRVSAVFVPAVLSVSAAVFLFWITLGTRLLPEAVNLTGLALTSAIGVLVIACPCALGLATPTAVVAAVGRGARAGILIKDADILDRLHRATHIVFDKTGTITSGRPSVVAIHPAEALDRLTATIGALEAHSEHPLAVAVRSYTEKLHLRLPEARNVKISRGEGISGTINGRMALAGNRKFLTGNSIPGIKADLPSAQEGASRILVAADGRFLGAVDVADTLKPGIREVLSRLKSPGRKLILLSGDNPPVAGFVARAAGIGEFHGGVLPHEKKEFIEKLRSKDRTVVMVGDGVNDAPALAAADIGVAVSGGTDAAIETAAVTLLKGDLSKLVSALELSKKTAAIIRQNLFWAFVYNVLGIPLAAGALIPVFGLSLNPVYAGLAMALSSVSVVANSLRLTRVKLSAGIMKEEMI